MRRAPASARSRSWARTGSRISTSLYNFPPASRLSMIARLHIADGRIREAGFLPVYIDRDAVPRLVAPAIRASAEVVALPGAQSRARQASMAVTRSVVTAWSWSPHREARRLPVAGMDSGALLPELPAQHPADEAGNQSRASGAGPTAHRPGDAALDADRQHAADAAVHLAFRAGIATPTQYNSAACAFPCPRATRRCPASARRWCCSPCRCPSRSPMSAFHSSSC